MNWKRVLVSGIVAGILGFLFSSILYMNPFVADLYAQYEWGGSKSIEVFGGMGNWLFLMMLGGIFGAVFMAAIYSYAEKAIGFKDAWKKGALFGVLIWLMATVPSLFNMWLMYTYPETLLMVEAVNGLIGGMFMGMVLAVAYEKIG